MRLIYIYNNTIFIHSTNDIMFKKKRKKDYDIYNELSFPCAEKYY